MSVKSLSGAVIRYRIMAWIVGVMLIAVFVTIPFQKVDAILGPIHGALYIVYLLTVAQLWIVARLRFRMVALMVTAGWLPFTAFVAERWVATHLREVTTAAEAGYTAEAPSTFGSN